MASQGEMEEVKSLTKFSMASITWPLRTPKDAASYLQEFVRHIHTKFNEPSPNKFSRELNEFVNLRNIALSTLNENALRDNSSLQSLKKYYCQLASILARFRDSDAVFSWKDSFGRGSAEGNLDFEINNIMYDIAAVHNEFGAKVPRSTEAANKLACSHFTSALWWVTELRDNRTGLKPKEMGHDLLTFFHHVLKAQAQECVLFYSLNAGMRLDNVAKIAAQIYSDYEVGEKLAHSPLYSDPLKEILSGGSLFNSWRSTVEFKRKYYQAMSQLLMGLSLSDDNAKEIGQRIARLKSANQTLESAKSLLSNTIDAATTKGAFEVIDLLVKKKLDKAIRYNDNVYHSSIPNPESLAKIESKLIIGPSAFSVATFPDFKDLFSNLVTIEAVQTSSIYSQKKDDLSRQISAQVCKKDEELAQVMSRFKVDKRNITLPTLQVPDELVEMCAELDMSSTTMDDVLTQLEELDDKSEEIQKLLDAAEAMLKRRPNKEFDEEFKRFRSTHETALRSTQSLHKQLYPELQQKIQLMATTDNPAKLLPKLDSSSAEDDEIVRKLEKLLDKVDEMKQQRASLYAQLRHSLDEDDVINHVVAATSEHELKNVFEQEIQKHNKYLQPLNSNLALQDEILDALERATAQYGQVKLNYQSKRANVLEQVETMKRFYNQFKATRDGIKEGLEYHNKMVELVRKFFGKVQASNELNDLLN